MTTKQLYAFPRLVGQTYTSDRERGMELRDWFAGQAIVGLISDDYDGTLMPAAKFAYALADAMLKAREDGQS